MIYNAIFNCNFMNEKFCILIKISLKFVPKVVVQSYDGPNVSELDTYIATYRK